jgi:hypothetical protein
MWIRYLAIKCMPSLWFCLPLVFLLPQSILETDCLGCSCSHAWWLKVHTRTTKCFQHIPCERALRFTYTINGASWHDVVRWVPLRIEMESAVYRCFYEINLLSSSILFGATTKAWPKLSPWFLPGMVSVSCPPSSGWIKSHVMGVLKASFSGCVHRRWATLWRKHLTPRRRPIPPPRGIHTSNGIRCATYSPQNTQFIQKSYIENPTSMDWPLWLENLFL